MEPRIVTFDCAGTLLKVDWSPGEFAVRCGREAGLDLNEGDEDSYRQLLRGRWSAYEDLNTTRDHAACEAFWADLTADWLGPLGLLFKCPAVLEIARERIFDCFEPFPDAFPALDTLDALGVRMAIISNWDYSLHKILKRKCLTERFEFALASLEEGPEKPDPRLFQIAIDKLGVTAADVAHIGDDPVDDYNGARNFGMRGLLIDRSLDKASLPRLARLTELPEVLGWTS